jgi:membrane protease YdiL (CAAX protease family)
MNRSASFASPEPQSKSHLALLLIVVGLLAFCAVFVVAGNAYFRFADARFPHVGTSAWLATLWGLTSRAHLVIFMLPFILWRPRLFGFQIGQTRRYWRMLLLMLLVNCGVIAGYLWLSGGGTPYSGNQWLVTEIVIVPVVEETFWRGLVFTALLLALRKRYAEGPSIHAAVWLSGVAFGLLHVNNVAAGVPLAFVAVQALSAVIWGVMYGYARAKTESVYPPMLLHAAMNLVVVLF